MVSVCGKESAYKQGECGQAAVRTVQGTDNGKEWQIKKCKKTHNNQGCCTATQRYIRTPLCSTPIVGWDQMLPNLTVGSEPFEVVDKRILACSNFPPCLTTAAPCPRPSAASLAVKRSTLLLAGVLMPVRILLHHRDPAVLVLGAVGTFLLHTTRYVPRSSRLTFLANLIFYLTSHIQSRNSVIKPRHK